MEHRDADPGTLLGLVKLPRSQVLPMKVVRAMAKAVMGREHGSLHLGIRAAARHGAGAKVLMLGLHHHVGDGDDGVLHAGGNTLGSDFLQQGQIADALDLQPVRPAGPSA